MFASPASATEFLVNTTIASTQIDTSVAALTGGGFVISWTDNSGTLPDNSSSAIRARRYDASGTALDASDFLVNTVINNAQHFSSVAGLSGGDFVIVWQDNIGDGSVGGIRARRYNAAGTALDTPEFLVNTTISNWQQTPSVAALTGGGFVIAWVDHSGVGDTSPGGIRARRFDASGTALDTNDFLVNTTIQNAQSNPSVAALTSGGFVIAWTDDSQSIDDSSLQAVRARRYNASGGAQGSDFPVNTITSSRQQFPSVAALSGDGFVITWEDASLSPDDTSSWAIRARRYDGTGAALDTPEFLVNTITSGKQRTPSVTALSGGGFGIAWSDNSGTLPDNSAEAVRARRYDANGVALDTSDFVANTIIFNRQEFPSVAGLSGGDFVITWEDRSNSTDDPFSSAIRADIFAVAPEMDIAGMGQSIPDGNAAPATTDDTDFGSADIAAGSVAHTFTVSNIGNAVLNLTGTPRVVIGGTNAGDFSLTTDAATTVAASGTTTFTVTFNPSVLGSRTATISIANDDANENPYNFTIQGTGTGAPEMDVAGKGQSILDGDSSPFSTDDTDYGAVALTGGSVAHTFTVSNSGPVVLNLTDPQRVVIGGTNAGDFSLTTDAATSVAAGGGTTTFTVTFNPGANGTRTATISIANDDANENPYNFTIQGTGVNTSPTGAVTITGTAAQGQTLSAVTTSIGDADGLGTFSYQWKRGGTNIATTSTYVLVQADVGSTLTVTVSYTDGGGTVESLTSAATASVANVNDAPTGAVTITGTATQGQTLTADASAVADIDGLGTFSYQWKRGGTNIATTSTYALVQADVGSTLTVTVSYTDGGGTVESLTSAATASVANINDAPTGAVTISGTAAKFQTLSAVTTTIADADGLGAFSYQWRAGGSNISSATNATLVLSQAEVGKAMDVVVSYTDGFGVAESLTSTATASVVHVNTLPTGTVTISGTATQGQTLSAVTTTIADADGLGVFSYQWSIAGATGTSYTVAQSDVGSTITVTVSYTDGFGTNESVTSAPAGPIAEVNDPATGSVSITGTPTQGQTLSADPSGISDPDGLSGTAFSYQWRRDGVEIAGESGSSLLLTQADVGTTIRVMVSFVDDLGFRDSIISSIVGPIANVNDAPSGVMLITGAVVMGKMLTADASGIADLDGLGTFSHQWRRGGSDIIGASASTYKLVQDDVGQSLDVTINYIDGFGASESMVSAPTGTILSVGTTLFSSVLPSARSGFIGGADITVFASVNNAGAMAAKNCQISIPASAPVTLSYQETGAGNAPVGTANTPFDLAIGQSRSFLLSFTPATTSPGENIFPGFSCDAANVDAIPGVNTAFLTVEVLEGSDVLSMGATPSGDGVINVPSGGTGFMTVSATNIGLGDADASLDTAVTVSVDTGAAALPLLLLLCETDAASTCITPLGTGSISTVVGDTPSFFAVFVSDQSGGVGVPLDPANARVFLRFDDVDEAVRSVTSAAVTVATAAADASAMASELPVGRWAVTVRETRGLRHAQKPGTLYVWPDGTAVLQSGDKTMALNLSGAGAGTFSGHENKGELAGQFISDHSIALVGMGQNRRLDIWGVHDTRGLVQE